MRPCQWMPWAPACATQPWAACKSVIGDTAHRQRDGGENGEWLALLSDDKTDLNIKTECKMVIKTQLLCTRLKSQLETSEARRRQMPRWGTRGDVPGPPANLTSKNTPGEATEPPKHHPQHESQQEKTSCAIPTLSRAARIWDGKKKRPSTPSRPIYKWWAICIKRHSIKTKESEKEVQRDRGSL